MNHRWFNHCSAQRRGLLRNWNGLGLRLAGPLPERDDVTVGPRCPRPTKQVFHKNFPRQFSSHPAAARADAREPRERENPLTDQQRNVTKSKRKSFAARGRTFSVEPFHFFWTSICWEVVFARSGWGICGCCSSSVWWPPGSPRRWVSVFSLY